MKEIRNLKQRIVSLITVLLFFTIFDFCSAAIIKDEQGNRVPWNKAKEAYHPNPILFCHGFASGGPLATWVEREGQKESEKPKLDEKLKPYFENYYNPIVEQIEYGEKPVALKNYTRFPYLELISFIDFSQNWRSQLIDRNSSIDTYQTGDYYVKTGERMAWDNPILEKDPSKKPLTLGWADKLNEQIQILRENYRDKNGKSQRITLVCHSMAGLTAREYLTNSKYSNAVNEVEKVVFIGVPNLGSQWANVATGLTNARSIGWLIPGVGWLFSSGITAMDKIVERKGAIDIDGDALRDMDPGERGSGFLKQLNSRSQPQGIDYFAIWGNGDSLTDVLVSRHLYNGEGDGVASKDSQIGTGVLNLRDSSEIPASHGTEALGIVKKETKPLLRFIDYSKPEVVITSPDPDINPITEIKSLSFNIKGTVSKEYLPADCLLKIETQQEGEKEVKPRIEGEFLYPSDLWNPDDPNSVVAEFDEEIKVDKPGIHTILVTVSNPGEFISQTKTTQVKVIIQKPVIYIQFPTTSPLINRQPLIKARIYSPDKININLSAIELKIDGGVVGPFTITPEAGGSDITISYTPTNELTVNNPNTSGINEGKHTITIGAKDEIGLSADEAKLNFEIFSVCPHELVKYMRAINEREKTAGLSQTTFKNLTTQESLGLPDGGINIPSLDALANYPFLSGYIEKLRTAIENLMAKQDEYVNTGAYWDINGNTKWTLSSLYKAAMGTNGSGQGLDTWTHLASQMKTNGIETIDLEEIKRCIIKLETLRLPVRGNSSIANYLWYAIVDNGAWNAGKYAPDGIGDRLYYPSELRFGDQGKETFPTLYNSAVRICFGGNIKKLSNLSLKKAELYITVTITEGNPVSLGSCHLGYFLPNVNAADFQKNPEAEVAVVSAANGTYIFNVTSYIQQDINNSRVESWYKGWFDNLSDYDNDWDRINWWPIVFIITPAFQDL